MYARVICRGTAVIEIGYETKYNSATFLKQGCPSGGIFATENSGGIK